MNRRLVWWLLFLAATTALVVEDVRERQAHYSFTEHPIGPLWLYPVIILWWVLVWRALRRVLRRRYLQRATRPDDPLSPDRE